MYSVSSENLFCLKWLKIYESDFHSDWKFCHFFWKEKKKKKKRERATPLWSPLNSELLSQRNSLKWKSTQFQSYQHDTFPYFQNSWNTRKCNFLFLAKNNFYHYKAFMNIGPRFYLKFPRIPWQKVRKYNEAFRTSVNAVIWEWNHL